MECEASNYVKNRVEWVGEPTWKEKQTKETLTNKLFKISEKSIVTEVIPYYSWL
jgi:hypothetical protein